MKSKYSIIHEIHESVYSFNSVAGAVLGPGVTAATTEIKESSCLHGTGSSLGVSQ